MPASCRRVHTLRKGSPGSTETIAPPSGKATGMCSWRQNHVPAMASSAATSRRPPRSLVNTRIEGRFIGRISERNQGSPGFFLESACDTLPHMTIRGLPAHRPLVFGHRGAAGLAPENTLPSFALADALGADVFELDVHASSDGVICVMHDPELQRTTDGEGLVRQRTWEQLQQLDAGYQFTRGGNDFPYRGHGVRIPSLEELLKAYPSMPCNIEIKQAEPAIVEEVVRVIERCGASGRVILAAEHDSIMTEIRRHGGDIATSFATLEAMDFFARVQSGDFEGYNPSGCALQIPSRFGEVELVTKESLAAARRFDLEVHVWTINQRDEMEALVRLGVDAIMSDLPGLARSVVGPVRS